MSNNSFSGESKPVKDLSHRIIMKIGMIDPNDFKSSNIEEIELQSNKKQKTEKWSVNTDSNTGNMRIYRSR